MKGLEVSEIPLSALERTKRVDAEYFQPMHLRIAEILASHPGAPITKVAGISDGNHFSISEEFADEGIPYFRGQDVVGHFFIEQASPVLITEKAYSAPHMVRSHLKRGDVLLSIVGTIGETSLVASDAPATCSCKLAILRPYDIAPEYLALFLRTAHGRSQIERLMRGAIQMSLLLEDMDQVKVTRFSHEFEQRIAQAAMDARQDLNHAKSYMQQAGQTILCALGLKNWQPPEPLTYTRRASEALAAERLDSDYFAPRVAELLNKLSEAGLTIGAVAPVRHERFSPGKEGEFDYIEIGNVRADGTADANRLPQNEAPSRASQIVRAGDVLTSSVRPIRRLSALVTPEQDGYVCSSGFMVLEPRDVPSEVLLTYLRLPVVCELMDLHTSASLYPAISETDLLALPYHPISPAAEKGIVLAVQSAHAARRKAHTLLDAAKRAVEIAIEESESAALEYLSSISTASH